jgi:hypothetical protein
MACFAAFVTMAVWISRMSAVDFSTMPNPDLVREFVEIALQMSYAELRDENERYNDL